MQQSQLLRIEKEDVPSLSFPKTEVLFSEEKITARNDMLQRAHRLGNSYKGKVRIQFVSSSGPREVYTTVWDVSKGYIRLKSGAQIPIHSITEISF